MRSLATLVAGALVAGLLAVAAPASAATRMVTIQGRGWGHGIGMSQYGAYGRALAGQSSTKILKHYYSGVGVRRGRVPGSIKVGMLQGRSSISLSTRRLGRGSGRIQFKVAGRRRRVVEGGPGDSFRVEASSTGGSRIYKNGRRIRRNGRTVFGDGAHPVKARYDDFGTIVRVGGKSYGTAYGTLQFRNYRASCSSGRCLSLVLVVGMQRYLYGLGEVPSSWPQQTLRAQSIAGRTYALRAMQTRNEGVGPCFCAVYDSVIDQAYIGDSKRTGSGPYWNDWKRAVNATNDKVVFRGGAPIQALYSSSSGGHTENNRNVWGGTQIPYLRGVRDNYDRARGANPNYRWRVTMPFRSFKSRLSGFYGLGRYRSFRLVRPFGVSGRVTIVKSSSRGGVRIAGTARTVRVSGWSIRSALSLKDSWFRVKVDPRVGANFTARNRSLGEGPGRTRSEPYPALSSDGVVVGQAQDFVDGRLVWRSDLDSVSWLRGPMLAAYDKLGGAQSELGMPLSDAGVGSGQGTARFDGGSLRKVDGVGVVPVWGAADERYGFLKRSCGEPTALPEAAGGATTWSFEGGAVTLGPAGDLTVDCS